MSGLPNATTGTLALVLAQIYLTDTVKDYDARHALVLHALALAAALGYPTGFGVDPKDEERPVVAYLELPGGRQLSWHMRTHAFPYDGHTNAEKYNRVKEFARELR